MRRKKTNMKVDSGEIKPNSDSKNILEGVYTNFNFVNAFTSFLGCVVRVHTVNDSVFEGILCSFSPRFQVLLQWAHEVHSGLVSQVLNDSVFEIMVLTAEDIVEIEIKDADIDCISRDIFLDGNKIIGSLDEKKSAGREKVFEPWRFFEESNCDSGLHLDVSGGWNPQEMFKQNEELYGVNSDFDYGLSMYTLPLMKTHDKAEGNISPKENETQCTLIEISATKTTSNKYDIKNILDKSKKKPPELSTLKVSMTSNHYLAKPPQNNQPIKKSPNHKNAEGQKMSGASYGHFRPKVSGLTNEDRAVNGKKTQFASINKHQMKSSLSPFAKEFIPAQSMPPSQIMPVSCNKLNMPPHSDPQSLQNCSPPPSLPTSNHLCFLNSLSSNVLSTQNSPPLNTLSSQSTLPSNALVPAHLTSPNSPPSHATSFPQPIPYSPLIYAWPPRIIYTNAYLTR